MDFFMIPNDENALSSAKSSILCEMSYRLVDVVKEHSNTVFKEAPKKSERVKRRELFAQIFIDEADLHSAENKFCGGICNCCSSKPPYTAETATQKKNPAFEDVEGVGGEGNNLNNSRSAKWLEQYFKESLPASTHSLRKDLERHFKKYQGDDTFKIHQVMGTESVFNLKSAFDTEEKAEIQDMYEQGEHVKVIHDKDAWSREMIDHTIKALSISELEVWDVYGGSTVAISGFIENFTPSMPGKILFVVFRGTQSESDIAVDAQSRNSTDFFSWVTGEKLETAPKVAGGFPDKFAALASVGLFHWFVEQAKKCDGWMVSGHSLGYLLEYLL